MTKKEMRQAAKDMLMSAISAAYYKMEDEDYTEEEQEEINKYIWQYGTAMAKAIGEEFYTA